MSEKLTHVDSAGKSNMVDVAGKEPQIRTARAEGFIRVNQNTVLLIRENGMKKGDVLTVAEIAGIMGAKKTSELIPLCHPLDITKIEVKTKLEENGVRINSFVKCIGRTGIEMEAITAVSIALITIYDMCKAVDKNMIIENIHLIEKIKEDL